jgi:hypothetical protein
MRMDIINHENFRLVWEFIEQIYSVTVKNCSHLSNE